MLIRLTGLSLLACAAVVWLAAAAKVRVDARAHLATADGLLRRAEQSGSSADRVAAGEACVRALGSHVPFDTSAGAAVTSLERIVVSLRQDGADEQARRLLADALAAIDRLALLYTPLVAERDRLAQLVTTTPATEEAME